MVRPAVESVCCHQLLTALKKLDYVLVNYYNGHSSSTCGATANRAHFLWRLSLTIYSWPRDSDFGSRHKG
jgi:hypothetical protein